MHIAYFVHDLSDPAVARRVRMLEAGGARLTLLGFRRQDKLPTFPDGLKIVDLGRTEDAQLKKRAVSVAKAWLRAGKLAREIGGCDVMIARNLEMLVVADRTASLLKPRPPVVYESLDIHRTLLSKGRAGGVLRAIERRELGRASLLMVSSPAFLDAYFRPVQGYAGPSALVENKPLRFEDGAGPDRRGPAPGPPWRIGWFGMIRCARSLDILRGLVRALPDQVEVLIAGRPALSEFDDFHAQTSEPGISFVGPYAAEDLERLYGQVHFTWAIDYFEEGQNSSWLLPNRLYEGGLHGSVPIAQASVETGRWLARHGAGVLLDDAAAELPGLFRGLTAERYAALRAPVLALPEAELKTTREECRALVERLGQLKAAA